jgi:hypothetical protein
MPIRQQAMNQLHDAKSQMERRMTLIRLHSDCIADFHGGTFGGSQVRQSVNERCPLLLMVMRDVDSLISS